MSNDDHPPQPRANRVLPLLAALLALVGVAMAVAGADATVTDVRGAAPIVDDASRQEQSHVEHSFQQAAVESAPPDRVEPPSPLRYRCVPVRGEARQDDGCRSYTRRGPPSA